MKTSLSLLAAAALAGVLLTPFVACAQSAADAVRIEVKVLTEPEHKDAKEAAKDAKDPNAKPGQGAVTHDKTLQISLSGKPRASETRTGHWAIYGKSGKDIVAADSADFKLEFSATGQQMVETKKVPITFTPERYDTAVKGKPGKKIEASGTKYLGWGVVIKDGDKIVGEAYEPMGLKAELNKNK